MTNHEPQARRLAWLTTTEVASIPKERAIVVQPIASVEQHGPHLPCYTDSLLAEVVTSRAIALTPSDVEIWVLPILAYGKSNEHIGYPGTIALRADTLIAICRDVGRSVAASGFRKLVFVNGHGGQPHLLEMVARDIREETGLQVFPLFPYRLLGRQNAAPADDAAYDLHGGRTETSLMLAADPSAVRLDRIESGSERAREAFSGFKFLTLEGLLPTAWLTRDIAPNGVIGDPRDAKAEYGEQVISEISEGLAGAFVEIASFEF